MLEELYNECKRFDYNKLTEEEKKELDIAVNFYGYLIYKAKIEKKKNKFIMGSGDSFGNYKEDIIECDNFD